MDAPTKCCSMCKAEKSSDDFYRRSGGGTFAHCKVCERARVKAHRVANPDYYKAFEVARSSNPDRRIARLAADQRWAQLNPVRRMAQRRLNEAVRSGSVKRSPCHVCGVDRVEAHHADYDRPLDVVWLCVSHHKQTHALARELMGHSE